MSDDGILSGHCAAQGLTPLRDGERRISGSPSIAVSMTCPISTAASGGGSGWRRAQRGGGRDYRLNVHRTGQSRGMKSTWGPGSIMNTASVARMHATAATAIAM